MDKLAKKKALTSKKTAFTASRPTLGSIQHLFPAKSDAVLLKEAGVTQGGLTSTGETQLLARVRRALVVSGVPCRACTGSHV